MKDEMKGQESLPNWLRQLLFDLYHPLGKRCMAEAFAPFGKSLQQFADAVNSVRKP